MKSNPVRKRVAVLLVLGLISACGGSDVDPIAPPPIIPPVPPPPPPIIPPPPPPVEEPDRTVAPLVSSSFPGVPSTYKFVHITLNGNRLQRRNSDGSGIPYGPLNVVTGQPAGFYSFRRARSDNSTSGFFTVGTTPSAGGQALSSVHPSGTRNFQLDRLTETTLPNPEVGTASFSGSYAGQYVRTLGPDISFGHMFGTVNLDVDFADEEVSGNITQRANSAGLDARDVTLRLKALDEGQFTGRTFGGSFLGGTSSVGDYRGLVVGEEGDEVVGHLAIRHSLNSAGYAESGVFMLTDD